MSNIQIPSNVNGSTLQSWFNANVKSGMNVQFPANSVWDMPTYLDLPNGVALSCIGVGAKPLFRTPQGIVLRSWFKQGIALNGIAVHPQTPTDAAVLFISSSNISVINCDISGGTFGLVAESIKTPHGVSRGENISIIGTAVHDNYNPNGMSSGVFTSQVDNLQILNSTFTRNGWQPGKVGATVFNHGVYVCGDCGPITLKDSAFINNAATGIEARSGGTIINNLFVDNPLQLTYGLVNGGGPTVPGGVTGTVNGNIMIGGRDISGQLRGIPISVGNTLNVTVSNNLIAQDNQHEFTAIQIQACALASDNLSKPVGIVNLSFSGNYVWEWTKGPMWINPVLSKTAVGNDHLGNLVMQTDWTPKCQSDLRAVVGNTDALITNPWATTGVVAAAKASIL